MLTGYMDIPAEEWQAMTMKHNYHTHNYLCGHATGTVCDYVAAAVKEGVEEIGISDHCRTPVNPFTPYLTPETLETDYLPQFPEAQRLYGDKIRILKAVEIEYYPGYDEYYRSLLSKLDYLILGQHEFLYEGQRMNSFTEGVTEEKILVYLEHLIGGVKSGFFRFIAHPDCIFSRDFVPTPAVVEKMREFLTEAKTRGIPVELNANGIRSNGAHYPTDLLVSLCAEENVPVIVSSDCHKPEVLFDAYVKRLYAHAYRHGLTVV